MLLFDQNDKPPRNPVVTFHSISYLLLNRICNNDFYENSDQMIKKKPETIILTSIHFHIIRLFLYDQQGIKVKWV